MIGKFMRVALVATIATALAGAAAVSASAKSGDVVRSGACSSSSEWKLKLSPEDGSTEVEFEVDSNHMGQIWHVRITKDGNQIFKGTRQTQGPSGSFTVRKVTSDPPGTDTYRARAHNGATGETCLGRATI